MQFRARVIHPDPPPADDDGDLQLPDELMALGDQLSDDAAHLARVYPAEFYDRILETELALTESAQLAGNYVTRPLADDHRKHRLSVVVLASALVLMIASPVALLLVIPSGSERDTAVVPAEPMPAVQPSLPDFLVVGTPDTHPRDVPAVLSANPSVFGNVQDVMLIYRASGPELDGLLDVLEQASPGTTMLSM